MNVQSMEWRAGVGVRLEGTLWTVRSAVWRALRRLGPAGCILLFAALICIASLVLERRFAMQGRHLQEQLRISAGPAASASATAVTSALPVDGRVGLQAFDDRLLAHDDIPSVLQDVLRLAEAQGLVAQRGDYRAQADVAGHFLRYRMSLPVRGAAPAVHRFMEAALLAQPSLALESVQFKRDRIESTDIEARIQWVVYAKLPDARPGPPESLAVARGAPR